MSDSVISPFTDRLHARLGQWWNGSEPLRATWLRSAIVEGLRLESKPLLQPLPDSIAEVMRLTRRELPILAGSDRNAQHQGSALHVELAVLVLEGWTPLQALQAATLNPAKWLGATDSLGTVAPGKLADLVLLDGNPLADITHTAAIRAVVTNGRYYDRTALDRLFEGVRALKVTPKGSRTP